MIRIGIDLGGTNIAVGAVDDGHAIVSRVSVPTLARPPADPQYLHPKQHASVSSHTQLVSRNPLISLP